MRSNTVLRRNDGPSEGLFRDALIAGLARVAAQVGRGALADRAGRTTRSLDMLFAGETALPSGKGLVDFLLADETALDEVLALYGVQLCPRDTDKRADMSTVAEMAGVLARFADAISDGVRDHNETVKVAELLRPLLPKLTAIVAEADAIRAVSK